MTPAKPKKETKQTQKRYKFSINWVRFNYLWPDLYLVLGFLAAGSRIKGSFLPVAAVVQVCCLWKVQGKGGSGQSPLLCAEAAQPKPARNISWWPAHLQSVVLVPVWHYYQGGFCSLSSSILETFLLFTAELCMLLSGWHAFDFSCPVKFLREAYFVCQHLLCKFFQRNISEGCSRDKRLHSQLLGSK